MKPQLISTIICILIITSFGDSSDSGDCDDNEEGIRRNGVTAIQLKGTNSVYIMSVPNVDNPITGEPTDAWCFDIPLYRVESEEQIGIDTHCRVESELIVECGTISTTDTDYFDLGNGNILVTRVQTTNQPTASDSSLDFTHIAGAISSEGSSILSGSGIFKCTDGLVRLSGHFNLDSLYGPLGEVTFDFLYVLDLKTRSDCDISNDESIEGEFALMDINNNKDGNNIKNNNDNIEYVFKLSNDTIINLWGMALVAIILFIILAYCICYKQKGHVSFKNDINEMNENV